MTIGIWVHGRHVNAEEWERLVWGEPPRKPGSLTRLVVEMLNWGPEHIGFIGFGTGASRTEDGLFESEAMKRYLLKYLDELSEFDAITGHPMAILLEEQVDTFAACMNDIFCDTQSQNTRQEIEYAARLFEQRGITHVVHITCGSHAARCAQEVSKARIEGVIPPWQFWYCTGDDQVYAHSTINRTKVVEDPHRGDDLMRGAQWQLPDVVQGLLEIKDPQAKQRAIGEIMEHLQKEYSVL
jgi:hypothetical protein